MDVVAREARHHLVRVHVRRGARAGLEDVDRELVVRLAGCDPVAGGGDPLGLVGVEQPSSAFTRAAAALIRPSQRATDTGIGSPETGKFTTAFVCLTAPELRPFLGARHTTESSPGPPLDRAQSAADVDRALAEEGRVRSERSALEAQPT